MAERKFDYAGVSEVYKTMQSITGDSSNSDSIAGILHEINENVHNSVDVCEEAIYGDLGKQLLLDWDNTSSNFDNFVTNFENWSTIIAQSAGDYSKFETDVKGFKEANPLGVTSGGISTAYTNTSVYHNYKQENYQQYETDLNNLKDLYAITGVEYITTDTATLLKNHKIAAYAMLGGDIASLALIAWHFAPAAAGATEPGTEIAVTGGDAVATGTELAIAGSDSAAAQFVGQTAASHGGSCVSEIFQIGNQYFIKLTSTATGATQSGTVTSLVNAINAQYGTNLTVAEVLAGLGFGA